MSPSPGEVIAEIGRGLLVLVGVARGDTEREAEKLAERVLRYRVFADGDGRMNLSVREIKGAVLLVPQFTLAADTSGGLEAELLDRRAAGARRRAVRAFGRANSCERRTVGVRTIRRRHAGIVDE